MMNVAKIISIYIGRKSKDHSTNIESENHFELGCHKTTLDIDNRYHFTVHATSKIDVS